jgi:hypothetical protein
MPNQVWVLRIDHRHGTNVEVFGNKPRAERGLIEYVDHWWDHEMSSIERPADDQAAVDLYFTEVRDETYDLEAHEVVK